MNPALLSPLLTGLFPAGAVGAELRETGDPALLLPEEAASMWSAIPKRRHEFAAGRLCARRALKEFGFGDYPLRMRNDRRPHWPVSVVGSISHAAGICGAVVAPRRGFHSIGLDIEIVGNVTEDVWPAICTPAERHWLEGQAPGTQPLAAALIFSAKEAFYKCQFALTGNWLEFDDVELDLQSDALESGHFGLRPLKPLPELRMPLSGQFRVCDGVIATGIALHKAH
jgi:4'-phosphopantetheinyl transferase EntD